jgi:FkbM family methyltransferase
MFYKMGFHGINIEANPALITEFYQKRPKDINLNIVISNQSGETDFYIMDPPSLSTLSKDEALRCESMGYNIKNVLRVRSITLDNVICKYCKGIFPDVLLIDAEGYDLEILKTISWDRSTPKVICIETIPFLNEFQNHFYSMLQGDISRYLDSKGYSIVAFTLINTIYIRNDYMKRA